MRYDYHLKRVKNRRYVVLRRDQYKIVGGVANTLRVWVELTGRVRTFRLSRSGKVFYSTTRATPMQLDKDGYYTSYMIPVSEVL
jgi:uncharacterized protein YqjF (DUF2071 family)